ncbi:MAG: hypothetical protein OEQ53_08005 [Saprospiraceae bacterium]|nr:hypothetical protein [Saprospiraceae bacterium]
MDVKTAEQIMQDTNALLESANIEARRSSSAVVTHMVCGSVRQIMQQYLSSFLLRHDRDPAKSQTLENLREQCLELNPRFAEIELPKLDVCYQENCNQDGIYCLPVEKVTACLEVANKTKDLIQELDSIDPG